MNALPVLKRELEAQARQPLTHWSRAGAVPAMLAAVMLFAMNNDFSPGAGANLLTYLHGWLFLSIWVFVPTLTADCLSRERREGTLGLLFLTNLKPFDIVLAKATAHALRAFAFWLATLPALTLPFLIGGAGWQHVLLSGLFNFMALCLALSAGMLASSRCKLWSRALVGAILTALFFWLAFGLVNELAFAAAVFPRMPGPQGGVWSALRSPEVLVSGIALPITGLSWMPALSRFPGAQAAWLTAEGVMAAASFLFLLLCLRLAARNVANNWRDEPPSARVQWLERKFCTPILGVNLLRRWLRHTLERNPVGWLEHRTWSGRTMMWGWLAVVTSIYVTIFSGVRFTPMTYEGLQAFIAWSLAVSMAFSAAGSFRRERETGVLELLLVSPTTSWHILSGRLKALWGQFLPALGLLFGIWLFLFTFDTERLSFGRLIFYATVLLTVPVIGLYFSLAKRSFLSAVLWTLAVGCVLPVVLGIVVRLLLPFQEAMSGFTPVALTRGPAPSGPAQFLALVEFVFMAVRVSARNPQLVGFSLVLAAVLQLANTAIYARRLHRNLERRQFALERGPA